jgi:hypothetical protein
MRNQGRSNKKLEGTYKIISLSLIGMLILLVYLVILT